MGSLIETGSDNRDLTYQFYAPDGERYGGYFRWRLWSVSARGNITLVLLGPKDFNRSLPAAGLIFHRLTLVGRRPLPAQMRETESLSA